MSLSIALEAGKWTIADGATVVELKDARGRDWTVRGLAEDGIPAIRKLDDGSFQIVIKIVGRRDTSFIEYNVSSTGVVASSGTTLTGLALLQREELYDVDLDGANDTGFAAGDPITTASSINVVNLNGGGIDNVAIGLVVESNQLALTTATGARWDPPAGSDIIGAREFGGGYTVMVKTSAGGYLEYTVSATGVVATTPAALTEAQVVALAADYGALEGIDAFAADKVSRGTATGAEDNGVAIWTTADGFEIRDDGGVGIALVTSRGRVWSPAGEDATPVAVRKDGTDYRMIVESGPAGSKVYSEFVVSVAGVVGAGTPLNLLTLFAAEAAYEVDINDDGPIGFPDGVVTSRNVNDLEIRQPDAGTAAYWVVEATARVPLLTSAGDIWTPVGGGTPVAVRGDGTGGYRIVVESGSGATASYAEFRVSDTGAVGSTGTAIPASELAAFEVLYSADINSDGTIGFALGDRTDRLIGDQVADDVGAFLLEGGGRAIVTDIGGSEPDIVRLVTATGAGWTPPSGATVVGVRADGDNFRIVVESGSGTGGTVRSYQEHQVNAEGVVTVPGRSVSQVELISLESLYSNDLNGDGALGLVLDDADRIDRGLIDNGDQLFAVVTPAGVSGTAIRDDGAAFLPITTALGTLWQPAPGSAAVGVRQDGDNFLIVVESTVVGGKAYTEFSVSAAGVIASSGTPVTAQLATLEETYRTDLNGDGVVRFATVDTAFQTEAQDPFTAKPAADRVLVVNPDGSAIVKATITDALAAVAHGGSVLVGAGIFTEAVTLNKADVTLVTEEGAEIVGTVRLEANGITIDGFTLDGDGQTGNDRGLQIAGGDGITVRNMDISNFLTGASLEFASGLGTPKDVTFTGNSFTNNTAGIGSTDNVQGLRIFSNTFEDNAEGIGLGGGVQIVDGASELLARPADVAALLAENTFDGGAGQYAIGDYRIPGGPVRYSEDGTIRVFEGDSIQAAVDAASAGDTIVIAAGTFDEAVIVTKELTILGANAGIAGNGTRGDETVLTETMRFAADDVTVDGLAFEVAANSRGVAPAGFEGGVIRNSVFSEPIVIKSTLNGNVFELTLASSPELAGSGSVVIDVIGLSVNGVAQTLGGGVSPRVIVVDGDITDYSAGSESGAMVNSNASVTQYRLDSGSANVTVSNSFTPPVAVATDISRGIQGDVFGRPQSLTVQDNLFKTDFGLAGTEDIGDLTVTGNVFQTGTEAIGFGVGVAVTDISGNVFPANDQIVNYTTAVISIGANTVDGVAYSAVRVGTSGDDAIAADGAGELLIGAGGNDDLTVLADTVVDGGAGLDTVIFPFGTDLSAVDFDNYTDVESFAVLDADGNAIRTVVPGQSIQAAIDAASAGEAIVVLPGTYEENLIIDKPISLIGANSGTPGAGSRADEAKITGSGLFGITILSDDVTVDGFEISGFERDAINIRTLEDAKPGDPGIGAYRANVTIANNYIHDDATSGQKNGVLLGEFSGDPLRSDQIAEMENITISGNLIELASSGARALAFTNHFTDATGVSMTFKDLTVDGNTIYSGGQAWFSGAGTDTFRIDNASVTSNAFTGVVNSYNFFDSQIDGNIFNSIAALGLDGSTVSNNTFNVNNVYGLGLWGDQFGANVSRETNISDNTFNYNTADLGLSSTGGVALLQGADIASITFDNNTFNNGGEVAIPTGDIIVRGTNDDDDIDVAVITDSNGDPVNAEFKILGFDGNDVLRGGPGDDFIDGGDGTDIVTYDGNAADYSGSVSAGVITVTGPDGTDTLVNVEALRFNDGFLVLEGMSIQAAIDSAEEGDTITVAAGDFEEDLVVNVEGLTLRSADPLGAKINTAGGFNAGSGFGGITILADNVTLDGFSISQSVPQAIIHTHDADNVTIVNNAISGVGTANPRGIDVGFAAGNSDGVVIDNNTFSNLYTGVYINQASDLTIVGNHFDDQNDEGAIVVDGTWPIDDVAVTDNTMAGDGTLVFFFGAQGAFTVSGNDLPGGGSVSNVIHNQTQGTLHATIQGAIDAAEAGDNIFVAPGTYDERFEITTDNLTLTTDPANPAILRYDGDDFFPIMEIFAAGVTVENFNMERVDGASGSQAVAVRNSDASILNNTITGTKTSGPGITVDHGPPGAYNLDVSDVLISGNTILGQFTWGIGIRSEDGPGKLDGVVVKDNVIDVAGQGIFVFDTGSGQGEIESVTITGNEITVDGTRVLFDNVNAVNEADFITQNTILSGAVSIEGEGGVFSSIQAAINAAEAGDTILVGPGTYEEIVTIDKGITLLSLAGADATVIERPEGSNSLGTVLVTPGTEGVTIGSIGQGFTIQGGDSPAPGIEWAAVYFRGGGHKDHTVQGNTIVANGDSALMTEFNASIDGLLIDSNLFTGQTFVGDVPATGDQFAVPNVARQMVVVSGGENVTNTKDVTFTNNTVEGTSGANGVGNVGVTIDVVGGTISGNTFAIDTGGDGAAALRVRGPETDVTDNIFTGTNTGFTGTREDATYTGNVFTGAAMFGTPGADRFDAGPADNIFFGGAGDDSFVFAGESIGANTINDFEGAGEPGGDLLDLSGLNVAFADLEITEEDGNTVITATAEQFEGTITLLGVAGLLEDDFLFSGPETAI